MLILQLYLSFIKIGLFAYGGGYVMLSLIEKEIIRNQGWLTLPQFIDIVALAEVTPGPIAVNTATFVGYKVGGVIGSVAATMGVITPAVILVLLVARYLQNKSDHPTVQALFAGLRPAVIALILSAAVFVGKTALVDLKSIFIALVIFIALFCNKIHPIAAIGLAALLGVLL